MLGVEHVVSLGIATYSKQTYLMHSTVSTVSEMNTGRGILAVFSYGHGYRLTPPFFWKGATSEICFHPVFALSDSRH